MPGIDIISLLRKIFVDEDVIATKESLTELFLLTPKLGDINDNERNQMFYIDKCDDVCFISRVYNDPELNVMRRQDVKPNIDIIRLHTECVALEKQLETNKIVYSIFSLMRNLINENIAIYYPVKTPNGVIYTTDKITVFHFTDNEDEEVCVRMAVTYSDKENNMEYCCEYLINENHENSKIIQRITGI